MKVITVAPISRGISKEALTYYTAKDVAAGSIVRVPLRSKTVSALVTDKKDASEIKSELRASDYQIKKVDGIASRGFLSAAYMASVREATDYFATTTGAALNTLLPRPIIENAYRLKRAPKNTEKEPSGSDDKAAQGRVISHEKFLIQADVNERFGNYKSVIREEFARGASVFFAVPTIENIQTIQATLEKGIEQYTYVLHGGLKKEELISRWNAIVSEKHAVLVIATLSFLSIPREDFGTIILEEENSRSYKAQARPFLDMRTFAEMFAKNSDANLIMGDQLLRTETIWRYKQAEFLPYASLKFRLLSSAGNELADMTTKERSAGEEFRIFGEELSGIIKTNKENNEHLVLYAARKGLAPTTICGDCGTVVLCGTCGSPTVLHTTKQSNFFLCHKCGERREADEQCAYCASWKLTPLGIGVERVEETLRKQFPDVTVFRLDKETASTHKKAKELVRRFFETPGSVIVGTEMMLRYITEPVENTAVVTIDPLFAIPDFRIHEKILSILLSLRALAYKKFLIQTRQPESTLFGYALQGNLNDYYRDEIHDRKQFNYPPFSTLIKISLTGNRAEVEREMSRVRDELLPRELFIFPAFVPASGGRQSMHAILKLPHGEWIDAKLLEYLRALPPQFEVNVNPESLL